MNLYNLQLAQYSSKAGSTFLHKAGIYFYYPQELGSTLIHAQWQGLFEYVAFLVVVTRSLINASRSGSWLLNARGTRPGGTKPWNPRTGAGRFVTRQCEQICCKICTPNNKSRRNFDSALNKKQYEHKMVQILLTFAIYILHPQNIEEQRQNGRQWAEHKSRDTNYFNKSYIK